MYQTPILVATFLGLQVYERVSLRWKGGGGGKVRRGGEDSPLLAENADLS